MIEVFVTIFSVTLLLLAVIPTVSLLLCLLTRRADDLVDSYLRKSAHKDFSSHTDEINKTPPEL